MYDKEIDDYNDEFFFEQEDDWKQYQDLFFEEDELTPRERDFSYNIFTLEQAITTIKDIGKSITALGWAAEEAAQKLESFVKFYTECMNGE